MIKKAVVFGGSGFLGSYVADELTRRGFKVAIADIAVPRCRRDGREFELCDIMNPMRVSEIVAGADVVYNFAGMANLDESLHSAHETMMYNVIGNINVLDACATI